MKILGVLIDLLAVVLTFAAHEVRAQSDSVADVFPLHIGNQWTYTFTEQTDDQIDGAIISDTGLSTYSVIGRLDSQDSVIWTFKEMRSYTSCFFQFGHTTCTDRDDSTTFDLVELLSGNHRIYRSDTGPDYLISILPSPIFLEDSIVLHRYQRTDSLGTYYAVSGDSSIISSYHLYGILFQTGSGIVSMSGSYFITGGGEKITQTLLSSIVNSVEEQIAQPNRFELRQCYPNPCNPTTTVTYRLPFEARVTITVYDALGREVQILLDQVQSPGEHRVTLNGSDLSSGVYFYMLRAGEKSDTKKFVIMK